jgi:type IV secretion system protein VirB6
MITNSTFFSSLYSGLITPLLAQLQAMIGNVSSTMLQIVPYLLLIWITFIAYDLMYGNKSLQAACKEFFIVGCVFVLMGAGQYNQYITDLFLTAVPNTIGQALGTTNNPAAALDIVLNTVGKAAIHDFNMLPLSMKSIPLGFGILIVLVVAAACLMFSFGVYMIASILNVIAVLIGPVFLALAVLPMTRRFTAGWFGVLVAGCVSQLLALCVIQLMAGAELTMINSLLNAAPAAGSDGSLDLLWGLAQSAMLLGLTAAVVKKVPSIAQAIAGGVHHGAAGLQAATFGAGAALGKAATGGVSRGAGAAVGAAVYMAGGKPGDDHPWRGKGPVGRSLSRGDR